MEKKSDNHSGSFILKTILIDKETYNRHAADQSRNFAIMIPAKAQPRMVKIYKNEAGTPDETGAYVDRLYRINQFTPQFQRMLLDKQVTSIFMDGEVCKARLVSGELIEPVITDPSDWVGSIFG